MLINAITISKRENMFINKLSAFNPSINLSYPINKVSDSNAFTNLT